MLTKSNVSGFTLMPVLFVMTLFLMLSVMSVSVILAGSGVYQKISDDMEKNYGRRVTFSYLTTKIRQNDSRGNIYVEEKNGTEMLAIKETDGTDEYVTYIYYYDGYIKEIYLELDGGGRTIDFDLSDGEDIIESQGFEFELLSDRIKMNLTDENGNPQSAQIVLRSQG